MLLRAFPFLVLAGGLFGASGRIAVAPTVVTPSGVPRSAPRWGFGGEFVFQTAADRGLTAAVAGAYSQLTRFPGGTPADYWAWETGWLQSPTGPGCGGCDSLPPRPTSIAALHSYLRASSQDTLLVLNTLTSNISHQLAGLRAHAALSPAPLLIELSNEMYDASRADVVAKYPRAVDYATAMAQWTAEIKEAFPNAVIAWDASSSTYTERERGWNKGVFPLAAQADAATVHLYAGLPAVNLSDASSYSFLLASVFPKLQGYRDMTDETIPSRLRLWGTEAGTYGLDRAVGTWLQALWHAAFALALPIELPRIDVYTPYCAVCGDPDAPSFTADGYGPVEPPGVNATAWHRTPSGHAYALVFAAARGAVTTEGLAFAPNPPLDAATPSSRTLVGLRFADSSGVTLAAAFVHLGSAPVRMDLTAVLPPCTAPSPGACVVLYYASNTTDAARQGISVSELTRAVVSASPGLVTIPPYAIAVAACDCTTL